MQFHIWCLKSDASYMEIDEICNKTPPHMTDYINQPELTQEVLSADGCLFSGKMTRTIYGKKN